VAGGVEVPVGVLEGGVPVEAGGVDASLVDRALLLPFSWHACRSDTHTTTRAMQPSRTDLRAIPR